MISTESEEYTAHLLSLTQWWKRVVDVQWPYRRHLQQLQLGLVLDVGCGIGRNLINVAGTGRGVGVDHNHYSVVVAQSRGLIAYSPDDFRSSSYGADPCFDSILISHVAEHMRCKDAISLLEDYVCYLKPGGRVILITPQEAGYRSEKSHIEFVDFDVAAMIIRRCGLVLSKQYSFPLPRLFGKVFKHNEFVTIGQRPAEVLGSVR